MDIIVFRLFHIIDASCYVSLYMMNCGCNNELVILILWAWWWVSSLVIVGSIRSWFMVNCDIREWWVDSIAYYSIIPFVWFDPLPVEVVTSCSYYDCDLADSFEVN